MFSMDLWDLAPGEAISQSQPIRVLQGSPNLTCVPPSLDTPEFYRHYSCTEDTSSKDSLGEFHLPRGEDRSQSPPREFHGSQVPRCPPPTLDTQEFEKNWPESEVWIVEDSLACWDHSPGEPRSQCRALDLHRTANQLCPALDIQDFKHNHVTSDNVWVVEDSLACWESAAGGAELEKPKEHRHDSNFQRLPSSILNTSGRSTDHSNQRVLFPSASSPVCYFDQSSARSNTGVPLSLSASRSCLPRTSPPSDSGTMKEQDLGPNHSRDCRSPPVPGQPSGIQLSESSSEGHGKVSSSAETEDDRELENAEDLGLVPLSPLQQSLLLAVPRTLSQLREVAEEADNILCKSSSGKRFALRDVTNSSASAARALNKYGSKKWSRATSVNQSTDCDRRTSFDEVFSAMREGLLQNHGVSVFPSERAAGFINQVGGLFTDSDVSEVVNGTKSSKVDASSLDLKAGCVAQPKPDEQAVLVSHSSTSRKRGQQDCRRIVEGWHCPREGKKFLPTSKQLSLDRWLN